MSTESRGRCSEGCGQCWGQGPRSVPEQVFRGPARRARRAPGEPPGRCTHTPPSPAGTAETQGFSGAFLLRSVPVCPSLGAQPRSQSLRDQGLWPQRGHISGFQCGTGKASTHPQDSQDPQDAWAFREAWGLRPSSSHSRPGLWNHFERKLLCLSKLGLLGFLHLSRPSPSSFPLPLLPFSPCSLCHVLLLLGSKVPP